jgi:hypothetical protein
MNPIGKKFIPLFLVFSIMTLSGNLFAKERRGAILIITKKNGQQIGGELITVKKDALLLFTGVDISIDIKDIKVIRIIKKSEVGIGFLLGGSGGALIGFAVYREPTGTSIGGIDPGRGFTALGCGIVGGLIGLVIGLVAGTDKTIQIEGITDTQIQETLEKLRKKARIRDYK